MKRKWIIWASLSAITVLLLCFFPLFRVKSLSEKRKQEQAAAFNASELVESIWEMDLQTAGQSAPDITVFLEEFAVDAEAAIVKYGNRVGVSSKYHFLFALNGNIQSIEGNTLVIESTDWGATSIEIRNGPVFGNAVRDGCKLFDVASFTDTRKFNDVSAELNLRVEQDVLPLLFEQVEQGREISSVGCFTLNAKRPSVERIKWIPVGFKVE